MKRIITPEAVTALRAALGRPFCVADLMAVTDASYSAAFQNLTVMRKAGTAHIAHYDSSFAKPVTFYELGAGEDAKRPTPVTNAAKQTAKRQRAKWGASEHVIDRQLAAKIEKERKNFEERVQRLIKLAETAKIDVSYGRRHRSGSVPKAVSMATSIAGQAQAIVLSGGAA